jgi:hypothetical protein
MAWNVAGQEIWVLLSIFIALALFEGGPKLLNLIKKRNDSRKG